MALFLAALALLAATDSVEGIRTKRRSSRREPGKASEVGAESLPLIPYPAHVELSTEADSSFEFWREATITVDEAIQEGDLAVETLREHLESVGAEGAKADQTINLRLKADTGKSSEGYKLKVTGRQLDLEANDLAGLFYGVQTLKQLTVVEENGAHVPAVVVEDAPRFGWRGLHLDVSRHYFTAEQVKKLINTMACFKLNRFHWHLTDDQGWRLPVEGLPKLTEVGAEGLQGRKSYTEEEIKEVVAYAAARHVQVMPEIDVPGHAQATIAAYPELGNTDTPGWEPPLKPFDQWGVTDFTLAPKDETWEFLGKVFDAVTELFPSTIVHMGGDEARTSEWTQSPAAKAQLSDSGGSVQKIFNTKVAEILRARNRSAAGWDEVQDIGGLANDTLVFGWQSERAVIKAAKAGLQVVNANQDKLYLDHYQGDRESEPKAFGGMTLLENVYDYDPIPSSLKEEEQNKMVLGAQVQLWSEYLPTWAQVEYMAFPRSLALAEKTWSPASVKDFADFEQRLGPRLKDLDSMEVNYRKLEGGAAQAA